MARSAEEMLYLAMEDFRIDIMVGKGAGATSILSTSRRSRWSERPRARDSSPTRFATASASPRIWSTTNRRSSSASCRGRRRCSTSASPAPRVPRSPAAREERPVSRTACSGASATTSWSTAPRRAPTTATPTCVRSAPPSTFMTWMPSGSTASTAPCWMRWCVASVGDRWGSALSRWPSAKNPRPSNRSWSPISSGSASWVAPRAAASPRRGVRPPRRPSPRRPAPVQPGVMTYTRRGIPDPRLITLGSAARRA